MASRQRNPHPESLWNWPERRPRYAKMVRRQRNPHPESLWNWWGRRPRSAEMGIMGVRGRTTGANRAGRKGEAATNDSPTPSIVIQRTYTSSTLKRKKKRQPLTNRAPPRTGNNRREGRILHGIPSLPGDYRFQHAPTWRWKKNYNCRHPPRFRGGNSVFWLSRTENTYGGVEI